MSVFTILNLFLLPCLITLLVSGLALNYKLINGNAYQRVLMRMLFFWAVIMVYIYIKFFVGVNMLSLTTISFVNDVCSMQVLLLGILCFVSLISYPIVALNVKYLMLKSWRRYTMPITIAVISYFAVNLITGSNPFAKYATMQDFIANIGTVPVASRLCLVVACVSFWARDLWRIWHVVPYYNQYVKENFSNSQHNVDWVRTFVVYVIVVLTAYLALLFFSSPMVNSIYLVALVALFSYTLYISLYYRTSELIERVSINLDPNNSRAYIFTHQADSQIIEAEPSAEPISPSEVDNALKPVDEWMESERPYVNVNFTTKDILDKFPQFTRYDLANLFRANNETFQTYVRRFRIRKACELLSEDENKYPQKIFIMVGFSHYSSFYRAFVALVGVTPSDYVKLPEEKKRELLSLNHLE